MKPEIIIAAMVLALAGTSHAVAQDAAASSQAPTPEAAARFIDTVLGSGVAKASQLTDAGSFSDTISVEGARTRDCKTLIYSPTRSPFNDRWRLEIDWRKFVAANSFFTAQVIDRWAVRILAPTAENLVDKDDIDKLRPDFKTKHVKGTVIEPGTEELKDRLIRAMEFYGKSCAPKLDGPF